MKSTAFGKSITTAHDRGRGYEEGHILGGYFNCVCPYGMGSNSGWNNDNLWTVRKENGTMLHKRICLCEYCVEAIRSRGEKVFVGGQVLTLEESEDEDKPCEWCGEHDNLYGCIIE